MLKQKEDFYYHDRARIINEDVLKTTKIKSDTIDLIVTSPPYNVDIKYNTHNDQVSYEKYKEFSKEWMGRCYEWLKDDGRLCLNIPLDKNKGGQKSVGADLTKIAQDLNYKYQSTIVWNEGNISRRTAWGSFQKASAPYVITPVELIVVFCKKTWKKTSGTRESTIKKDDFIEWSNGLWSFNGESKKRIGHPAPFPVVLPRRCIQLFSFKWDTILDPFLGSGSTLVASTMNDRIGIGIEIDTDYCEIAKKRLETETKDKLEEEIDFEIIKKIRNEKYPDRKKENYISQSDILYHYFLDNPNRDISYAEVKNWLEFDYKNATGLNIKNFDRRIRELAKSEKIKKTGEGMFRYDLPEK